MRQRRSMFFDYLSRKDNSVTSNPSTRSVAVQLNLRTKMRSVSVNTTKMNLVDAKTSPLRIRKKELVKLPAKISKRNKLSSSQSSSDNTGGSMYVPSQDSEDQMLPVSQSAIRSSSIYVLEKNPKLYLGISTELVDILNKISIQSKIDYVKMLITLKKIRLNDTYARLAVDFDRSTSEIQRIFVDIVPKLASFFQNLIFWSESSKIIQLLPIPFRSKYAKVESIMDCFETEIEMPSDLGQITSNVILPNF